MKLDAVLGPGSGVRALAKKQKFVAWTKVAA